MPMKRITRSNTTNCLWPYILRILRDGPSHAYVLREEIEKRFGFRVGRITSYKVLYSLTRKGYVKKREEGRKQVYTITPKGKELLRDGRKFYSERAGMLS